MTIFYYILLYCFIAYLLNLILLKLLIKYTNEFDEREFNAIGGLFVFSPFSIYIVIIVCIGILWSKVDKMINFIGKIIYGKPKQK